jgi:hypothetical protein
MHTFFLLSLEVIHLILLLCLLSLCLASLLPSFTLFLSKHCIVDAYIFLPKFYVLGFMPVWSFLLLSYEVLMWQCVHHLKKTCSPAVTVPTGSYLVPDWNNRICGIIFQHPFSVYFITVRKVCILTWRSRDSLHSGSLFFFLLFFYLRDSAVEFWMSLQHRFFQFSDPYLLLSTAPGWFGMVELPGSSDNTCITDCCLSSNCVCDWKIYLIFKHPPP